MEDPSMTSATTPAPWPEETVQRYADLVVAFAANVQPDQVVAIEGEVGQEWLVRALAARSYAAGARFVDAVYFDPYVKRSRLLHAQAESLGYVPPWLGGRLEAWAAERAAWIRLRGPAHPSALADVEADRAGRDILPRLAETGPVLASGTVNWTLAPCPSPGWARLIRPEADPETALDSLAADLADICLLDRDDPSAAWRERFALLEDVGARLTERRFAALEFHGPGTDLHVGLLPTSRFLTVVMSTADGVPHVVNIPSEEIFSAPDPLSTEGVVRATKPLVVAGAIVEGVELEFQAGRCIRADATTGADALRNVLDRDDGARRLGEVALVDRHGRVNAAEAVFYETLLDENAASHIALGGAYPACVDNSDRPRLNESAVHIDVMIGSSEVRVTGVDDAGRTHPVLDGGVWDL
jgi:aminopeptidase